MLHVEDNKHARKSAALASKEYKEIYDALIKTCFTVDIIQNERLTIFRTFMTFAFLIAASRSQVAQAAQIILIIAVCLLPGMQIKVKQYTEALSFIPPLFFLTINTLRVGF